MNTKTTAALLILFFAGLLGLWYAEWARIPTAQERRRTESVVLPQLYPLKNEEIRRVEIDGGPQPLAFERDDDGRWIMMRPVRSLADRSRLEALIANLRTMGKSREAGTIAGNGEGSYGLSPPQRIVRVFGANAREPLATLQLGKALGDMRYVRPGDGAGVEVVDARRLASVDLPAVDWRERSLFATAPFEVEGVTVLRGGQPALMVERPAGKWWVRQPIRAPGDEKAAEALLAELTSATVADDAAGFVKDDANDLAAYGLEPPALEVRLALQPVGGVRRSRSIFLGRPVPDQPGRVYARRADGLSVLKVDRRLLAAIPDDPHVLRSRHVADLAVDRVDFVQFRAGNILHKLARQPDGWKVVAPLAGPADRAVIEEMLGKLNALEYIELRDPSQVKDSGLDDPATRNQEIEVWEGGLAEGAASTNPEPQGRAALRLSLGLADPLTRSVYGRAEGDPAVMVLPLTALDVAPKGKLAFRDRTMLALDRARIDRLRIAHEGRTATLAGPPRGNDFAAWRLVEPVQAPADAETVARMVVLLGGLRAEGLIQSADALELARFGLDRPWLSVSWGLKGDSGSSGFDGSLHVGALSGMGRRGARFARIEGEPTIFTLAGTAAEILSAEPRDHRLFQFAPERVRRVVLTSPAGSLAMSRSPTPSGVLGDWQVEVGSKGGDLTRAEPLARRLGDLRTIRFLQYDGPLKSEYGLDHPFLAVTCELKDDPTPRVLRIGAPDGQGVRYATTGSRDSGAVFLLPAAEWEAWAESLATLPELPADVFAK